MGECGCSMFQGGKRFPGPDGTVYVLEIYPGCEDCGTPVGVSIHRYQDTPDERQWFEGQPDMEFKDYRGRPAKPTTPSAAYHRPVFDPDQALENIKGLVGDLKVDVSGEEMTLQEMIDVEPWDWRQALGKAVKR